VGLRGAKPLSSVDAPGASAKSADVLPAPHAELAELVNVTLPVAVTLVALFFTVTVKDHGHVVLAAIDFTSTDPFGTSLAAAAGIAIATATAGAAQTPAFTS
jgi:hypothetical protein